MAPIIMRSALAIFTFFAFLSCRQEDKFNPADIKGNWYLNKWTSYNTLMFYDTTVFVDNNVDTVFTLHYTVSNDSLITWGNQPKQIFSNKIISLTKNNLVLEGIGEIKEKRVYTRTRK